MKKIMLSWIYFCIATITIQADESKALFLGKIVFPATVEKANLCLYYKGQKLTSSWNKQSSLAEYSFIDLKTTQKVYFLICDNLGYETHCQNTIESLRLPEEAHYICYELQADREHTDDQKISFFWNCSTYILKDGVIPDNTFIFMFNPYAIKAIEILSWNKQHAMRLLPTIIISEDQHQESLKQALLLAQLKSIDIDSFHAKTTF